MIIYHKAKIYDRDLKPRAIDFKKINGDSFHTGEGTNCLACGAAITLLLSDDNLTITARSIF